VLLQKHDPLLLISSGKLASEWSPDNHPSYFLAFRKAIFFFCSRKEFNEKRNDLYGRTLFHIILGIEIVFHSFDFSLFIEFED